MVITLVCREQRAELGRLLDELAVPMERRGQVYFLAGDECRLTRPASPRVGLLYEGAKKERSSTVDETEVEEEEEEQGQEGGARTAQ